MSVMSDPLAQLQTALVSASNAVCELKDARDWPNEDYNDLQSADALIDRALRRVQAFTERDKRKLERERDDRTDW